MKKTLKLPDLHDIMEHGDVGLSDALSFWSHFANMPPSKRGRWHDRLAEWDNWRKDAALGNAQGGPHNG